MSAEIVLLKHPDVRIETNPQVIVCEAVPDETTERHMARLGFSYFPDVGAAGIFATVPPGWSEDAVLDAYRIEK